MIRRTRVEIDLQAIVGNAVAVRAVTGTSLYAVVKADAYGHGAVSVATALAQAKAAAGFCVSLVEEGVALRDAGVTLPILVMGPSQVGGEDDMVAAKLTPVISSDEELEALVDVAKRRNVAVEAHLKIDTGMARLGVSAAYLSLVERGAQRPTEALLRGLAAELGEDPEPLLALAGRVPEDVTAALRERPLLAEAVRALRDLPEPALRATLRRIRDGDW